MVMFTTAFVSPGFRNTSMQARFGHPDPTGATTQAALRRLALAMSFGLGLALLEAFGFRENEFMYRVGFWMTMMVVWVLLLALAQFGLSFTPLRRARAVTMITLCFAAACAPMVLISQHVVQGGLSWDQPLEIVEGVFKLFLVAGAFELMCVGVSLSLRDRRPGKVAPSVRGMRAPIPDTGTSVSPIAAPSCPPLVARLPFHLQGPVLCLQMEDHYVRVHTPRGSALLLMRFTDALAELEPASGMRVHRSWWIATDALAGIERSSRTTRARLVNGIVAPVSQPYVHALLHLGVRRNLAAPGGQWPGRDMHPLP